MVSYHIPTNANSQYVEALSAFVGIISEVEKQETGECSSVMGNTLARALANAGYSIKPSHAVGGEEGVFEVLTVAEFQLTGAFRATVARSTAKALIDAGCSL